MIRCVRVRSAAVQAVKAEMARLEALLSHYQTSSDVGRVNGAPAGQAVPVSAELIYLIERARRFSELSHGAFDITVGSAEKLYDLRRGRAPSAERLRTATDRIDYRRVHTDAVANTVTLTLPDMSLDLGGIGKGYAVDRCVEKLRALGIHQAALTAGGDTRLLGNRGDRPWWVGIRHPRDREQQALVLPLEDTAISTSGDYERFFVQGKERVHHILSPKTGRPTTELASVSVLHAESTSADALATTLFVLGTKAGMALVERLPDVDAIFIDRAGNVFYSSALSALSDGPAPKPLDMSESEKVDSSK
ncbi:MAG: FAD:protein FMN transferase [Gammaproteobacteria bacterium]